jgi:hypothetical protein
VTELTGADGKRKAMLADGFTKPADPKWHTNPVAVEPLVPPPWTAIKVNEQSASFLMGDCDMGKSTWPQQIRTRTIYDEKRSPILRAPMALKGRVNGKEIAWTQGEVKTSTKRDDLVELQSDQQFEGLGIRNTVAFEYDGMAKVTMDLAPAAVDGASAKPSIDALWLEVPLTPEVSKLFHYAPTPNGMKGPRSAGALHPDETLKWEFIFSIWLGDEERGFRWFAENWRGWHLDKKSAAEAIEVENTAAGATLRVHFVKGEKPFVLDKPREIVFGYQFTPARTLDKRMMFETASSDRLQFEQAVGVTVAENWYYKYQGWPEIYSDKERQEKLEAARYHHAHGIKLVPYSGWYIARDSDVYKLFGGEIITDPVSNTGCGCDANCWNTSGTDAYIALLRDRIVDTDIDGFRMDAGFSTENCVSLVHRGYGSACGWIDDEGKLQPSPRDLRGAQGGAARVPAVPRVAENRRHVPAPHPPGQPLRRDPLAPGRRRVGRRPRAENDQAQRVPAGLLPRVRDGRCARVPRGVHEQESEHRHRLAAGAVRDPQPHAARLGDRRAARDLE